MKFETLYKSTKGKAIQEWNVNYGEGWYEVEFGQENGKKQTKWNEVKQKNVGKKNETSLIEQSCLEAQSKWNLQVSKGYLTSRPEATTVVLRPMLAHTVEDHLNKITFPCYVQAKHDGCVSGDTLLDTKEYGIIKIADIVNKKIKCSVKSFNISAGKFEYQKVENYFINRNTDEPVQWFEVSLNSGEKLVLTGNHRVFLPDLLCWRRVDELDGSENLMVY